MLSLPFHLFFFFSCSDLSGKKGESEYSCRLQLSKHCNTACLLFSVHYQISQALYLFNECLPLVLNNVFSFFLHYYYIYTFFFGFKVSCSFSKYTAFFTFFSPLLLKSKTLLLLFSHCTSFRHEGSRTTAASL